MPASKITETLYSAPETATMLRLKLGPLKEWSDFLADCRRGRTSLHGQRLLPFLQSRIGGCLRPFYRAGDIAEFIRYALLKGAGKSVKLTGRKFEFDDPATTVTPNWRSNILTPIARRPASGFTCRHNIGAP